MGLNLRQRQKYGAGCVEWLARSTQALFSRHQLHCRAAYFTYFELPWYAIACTSFLGHHQCVVGKTQRRGMGHHRCL